MRGRIVSGGPVSALVLVFALGLCGCTADDEGDARRINVEQIDRRADEAQQVGSGPGAEQYLAYCAACHRDDGSGIGSIYPPLDGSDFLADRERTIDAIINGLQGPITIDGKEYNGTMPPLPPIYDNETAAAVINYVIDRFGGGSWQTTAEEVAAIRD